jgi:hypothetical protein
VNQSFAGGRKGTSEVAPHLDARSTTPRQGGPRRWACSRKGAVKGAAEVGSVPSSMPPPGAEPAARCARRRGSASAPLRLRSVKTDQPGSRTVFECSCRESVAESVRSIFPRSVTEAERPKASGKGSAARPLLRLTGGATPHRAKGCRAEARERTRDREEVHSAARLSVEPMKASWVRGSCP